MPAACSARQRAENIVLGRPGRAALVHETLDVRTQAGGESIDFGPQRRIVGPIDELELEQPGRPDAQILAGRIRYAEIGSQHLEGDPARQRIDDFEITFRVRHDLFGELVDRGAELGDIGRPHDLQEGGDVVAIDLSVVHAEDERQPAGDDADLVSHGTRNAWSLRNTSRTSS